MHVDDDPPSEELLGVYRTLLSGGVQIRRVLFLRSASDTLKWVSEFGEHPNLMQRLVAPDDARFTRMSFAVVDGTDVLVSVPGDDPIDDDVYAPRLVLRHLLVIADREVAGVFARAHEGIWRHAHPFEEGPMARKDR